MAAPCHCTQQIYLVLGALFMAFYVRWLYLTTSFMVGYNKARKRNQVCRACLGSDGGMLGLL